MPELEIITRRPDGAARSVPLLFVHGAFTNAAIWDARFLPWFAANGWHAAAVSLRGHGNSAGREGLPWHSLADYVEDALAAYDSLPAAPVVIGHSMGGMVVQRVLLRRRAPGAVLMASAPPHGLLDSTLRMAWQSPDVFRTLSAVNAFGAKAADLDSMRRAMMSDRVPVEEMRAYEPLFQDESRRVLMDLMHWNPVPSLPDRSIPVLVMGAEDDRLFPPDQVRTTASFLRTEPVFVPDMAHAMMLEPGWETVARRIADWVEQTVLARAA